MSQLCLMQEVAPLFNANPDGGVFLISSSIAVGNCRDHQVSKLTYPRVLAVLEVAWATVCQDFLSSAWPSNM